MKVRVEAKPLHEPLAGGTPGATVTVEPIVAGTVTWPRTMMERPGRALRDAEAGCARCSAASRPRRCRSPAFLIRHPSAGAILVDTGLHPSIATDGKENFGGLGGALRQPGPRAGEDVPAQLRERGLDPGEIPIVVMTHMHIDHTSAISEFPSSTFVLSETEWEAPRPAAEPAAQRLPAPPLRLRLRLPHGRLRPRRDRLLRELRPLLRPLRRRLDPARLHPRPQRRPHVGDLPT